MQNPPPNQPGDEKSKTALGLDANLGAALGYPIGIIALILFIMEKENRFARFHALQSLLYHVAWVIIFIVVAIVFTILGIVGGAVASSASSSAGGCFVVLLPLVWLGVILAYFAIAIFAAIKAYGGNWFKLPFIGNMAEKIVNK